MPPVIAANSRFGPIALKKSGCRPAQAGSGCFTIGMSLAILRSPFVDRADDLARGHVGRSLPRFRRCAASLESRRRGAAFPQGATASVLLSRPIADKAVLADIAPGGCEVAVPGP
ncbi:hypothetical protein WR25_24561 [Diploscapter pachys]|uniref:Uncharacterized protein n=1 Tax=Diploscapter pachys TaxID=2018661 RepID=A0A2A2KGA0_9BILA|nr:hypothetical protein WR25_24561 [Diploscapter pachys]